MSSPGMPIRFTDELLARPPVRPYDIVTTLRHFAIVTYTVNPEQLRPLIHPRFDLDCITNEAGKTCALVSVVPFEDQEFHFAGAPALTFRFGQTNYRAYVIDRQTQRRLVWFFGTTLDSLSVFVPRILWRLPWHPGRIQFTCSWDSTVKRYTTYRMQTKSRWAPVDLEIEDTGQPVTALPGFADVETGYVILTHPLRGVYYRRDGHLGSYHIWHDRLQLSTGRCIRASFPLLERLNLVTPSDQQHPHSILIQEQTLFTVYLPPTRLQ